MPGGLKKHVRNLRDNFRGAIEYKDLLAKWPVLKQKMPQGDGHPVLIIPGFTANDGTITPLCDALKEKGYNAHTWGRGRNLGLNDKTAKHLRERLEKLYTENGNQKVTLIGHSLGGFYARELAREFPDMVRDVITIGTPFGVGIDKKSVLPPVRALIEKLNGGKVSLKDPDMAQRLLTPPPVPTTSVFSKTDLVAGWKVCLNPAAPEAENVEVKASHVGLIYSADTFAVVMDRLAQPEGSWKPYSAASPEIPPQNPCWKQGNPPKPDLFKKKA
ncbi:MAG: alpha/beta fold hydrolase [Alphaproteobacteria bacterium]|nr:alpha/beta fold hydrolase [Alphaproteobacteria bacterium]